MIIEKLHIDCFGNLKDCTYELSSGVNIIEGANESGKSTLAAFIKFIFYGLDNKTRNNKLSERERYINWHTGRSGGYLIICTKATRYRIERTIAVSSQHTDGGEARKSYREGLQIINLSNNSPLSGIDSPGEYFFGADEELFCRTAFVSQLEGAKINGDKLTQSIENILFSANESVNIAKAVKKLDASRVALLHKNGAGGQIHELELKCAQLEEKLEKAKKTSAEILEKESSLRDAKKKHAETLARAEQLKAEIKNFEYSAVADLFDKLHSLEAKHESAKKENSELKNKYTVDGVLPDDNYIGELEAFLERINRQQENADNKKVEFEKLSSEINAPGDADKRAQERKQEHQRLSEKLEKNRKKAKAATVMLITFVSVTIVFILCGLASIHFDYYADIGKILVFSALFPCLASFLFLGFKAGLSVSERRILKKHGIADKEEFSKLIENDLEYERVSNEKNEMFNKLEAEYKSALEQLEAAKAELKAKLTWKFTDDITENIRAATHAQKEISKSNDECDKLNSMLEMLNSQLSHYNEKEIRQNIDTSIDISDVNVEDINAKRREYDFTSKAAKALETRVHELEKALASLYPQSENSARIAEKIELAHTAISEYRKKHAAFMLAIEKIEEASENMRDNITPKLADFTSKHMSKLTNGKYSEIGIDSEFKVNVRTDAGTRELGYLSAGTQDITYVSMRLALINSLFRKQMPAVIFDESFSRLDDTRLSQMLKLIKLTDTDMQSILFTSNSREARLMNAVGEYGYIKL